MGGNDGLEPLRHGLAEHLVVPGAPGTAQHRKFTGEAPLEEQLEQGRYQLTVRQIPGRTEDDQALGRDDPLLAQANPQGIGQGGGHEMEDASVGFHVPAASFFQLGTQGFPLQAAGGGGGGHGLVNARLHAP